jgi:cytochrome P450
VFTLARAILNDKSVYGEDVENFRPERFMKGDELNQAIPPPDAAFGYGRRACPGRHLAEASMWIMIVSLLAVFDFKRKDGDEGKDYGSYTPGVIS